MMAYMEANPLEYGELIQLALADKQPYSWRAAWLLSNCMEKDDKRVKSFIPQIINRLPTAPDGQKRDLINVLRKMEIEEEYEGLVFDNCVNIWTRIDKIPSVRYNALRLILQITEKHPELFTEVDLLTQNHYIEPLSEGIRRSIQRMISKVKKKHGS